MWARIREPVAAGATPRRWVRSDARSAEVGAQAIEFVRAFGAQQGWRRLDVSAPPDAKWDRTVAFYRKQGFEIAGRKLKYRLPAS